MTIPKLIIGGAQGINIGPDFMTVIGAAGLLSSPNPAGGSFDLDNLDRVRAQSTLLFVPEQH